MAITEQQKALSLVNLLRLNAPKADVVPAGIRTAYAALLTAYRGLSPAEQERVFLRARYDAAPAERRDALYGDPDLLVTARYGGTQAERLEAAKELRRRRRQAQGLPAEVEPGRAAPGGG